MSESSSLSSSSGRFVHQGLVFDGNRRFHAAPQGRLTKLTAAGKVLARHFMEIPMRILAAGKVIARHFKDIPMRILAAVVISATVVGILAAVAIHHEDEILPEVKNYIGQRMTDAKGLWAKVDMNEFQDYIGRRMTDAKDLWAKVEMNEFQEYIKGFFTSKKKYLLEVTPDDSTSFLDLFKWKKNKQLNVKIADL